MPEVRLTENVEPGALELGVDLWVLFGGDLTPVLTASLERHLSQDHRVQARLSHLLARRRTCLDTLNDQQH